MSLTPTRTFRLFLGAFLLLLLTMVPQASAQTIDHFLVGAPSSAPLGQVALVTVTAQDSNNDTVTSGYTGVSVTLTSADAHIAFADCGSGTITAVGSCTNAGAALTGNDSYSFTSGDSGIHTFEATFGTPREFEQVTATDSNAITGTSGYVQVLTAALSSGGTVYSFGAGVSIGSNTPQSVVVTLYGNSQNNGLTLNTITTAGSDFAAGAPTGCTTGSLGSSLTAATTVCTVPVTFTPSKAGKRTGQLIFTDNASPTPNNYIIGLSAVGDGPQLAFTPGTINTASITYPATESLGSPEGGAIDDVGNFYISDAGHDVIWKVTVSGNSGTAQIYAGTYNTATSGGITGDGGAATSGFLNSPTGIRLDSSGNLYIADTGDNLVRKVDASTGIIVTVAGNLTAGGGSGDLGAATAAGLANPTDVAVDASGDVLIADDLDSEIREVSPTGLINTVAGNINNYGTSGDGGPATLAGFNAPYNITLDDNGNLFVADHGDSVIRVVNLSGSLHTNVLGVTSIGAGDIETVAGTAGTTGAPTENVAANTTLLNAPLGLGLDSAGELYFADSGNNDVRRIDLAGTVNTVAGSGAAGDTGDGGAATSGELHTPFSEWLDNNGSLYIADQANAAIRTVAVQTGVGKDFGGVPVGTTVGPQNEFIYNVGNQDLSISDLGLADNTAFELATPSQGSDCSQLSGGNLTAGNTCLLRIDFQPSQVTTYTTTISVQDNTGNSSNTTSSLTLVGEGVTNAGNAAALTPLLYNYHGVSTAGNASATFTLSNPSTADALTINASGGIVLADTTNYSITGGTCANGGTVADNGGSCTIIVQFAPQSTGAHNTTLTVTDSAGTQTATLDGVGQEAITVTANSPTTTYGTVITPSGSVTSGSLQGGDTLSSIGITCATTDLATSAVGSNPTTSCSGSPANYAVTFVNGTVTVNQAAITVTANSPTTTYGTAATASGTVTTGTLYNGDTVSSIGITCSTTDSATSAAGSSPTTSCSGTPTNYAVTYVGGTVTVNQAPITVTANSPTTTYGTVASASGTVTVGTLYNGDTVTSIGITCTTTDAATSAVGSSPTTSCSGSPTNYSVTYVGGTVTVNKLAITVTANSPTTTYGTTITASGTPSPALIGSDTLSSIGITCSTTDVITSAVGSNPTTSCSGSPSNYSVTYVGGTVTVNKLPITVTANSPTTTYGTAITATGTPSPALIGSDTLSSIGITCSTTDVITSAVGSNPTTSCSGTPSDYSVTYVGGTVTVNQLPVTVTANSPTTTYGTAITASGTPSPALIGSDTLTSIGITCSTTDTITSAVGSSPTTSCSGSPSNYSVTYVGGTVTVNKLPITVTANSPTTTYGTVITASGTPSPVLIGSDTLTSIGITCSTTDTITSAVGSNPTTSCSGTPSNYSVTYVGGTVTINKLPITVTANSPTTTYGTAITASGTPSPALIGSDTLSSIGITCSTTDVITSAVGSNPTTSCSGSPSNYSVTYVGGTVTVNKLPITVTANSPTTTYGTAITASGTPSPALIGSDTLTSIGVTCSTTDTITSAVGSSPTTSCSGTPSNYSVTYVGGTVTVNQLPITVTANSPTTTYGTAITASGTPSPALIGSDTLTSIGITCSTTDTITSAVGSNPTTSCSGTPSNYSVTYVGGTVTVNKLPITVTANSPTTTYGTVITASGTPAPALIGSDTLSSIGITCSTTDSATSAVGSSPTTSCSGTPTDYSVTYVGGTVTVNKLPITVTANSPTTTYGTTITATGTPSPALIGSDTLSSIGITCSTADSATSAVGSNPTTSCSGNPSNYSVTYVGGTVTINQLPITVTANSPTTTYGTVTTATGTPSPALIGSDTLSSIGITCSTTDTITSVVGSSPTTSCSGSPTNYSVTYVGGTVTVNQLPITVTANSPTTQYGTAITASGTPSPSLIGSDTLSSIGITCATTDTATSAVGSSPTTSCSGIPANYSVTFVAGTVNVVKLPITVTANSPATTYGTAVTASGTPSPALIGSDTLASIGVTCSTTDATTSAVGSNPTTSCSGTPSNYTVTYFGGTVTVNQLPITVTANSPTTSYGTVITASGTPSPALIGGDTLASIGITCGTTDAVSSAVGSNPTTSCSGSPTNYSVTYVGGTVTITQLPITVTANSPSTTYGTAATASGTVTIGSLIGSDTLSSIGVTCATTDVASSAVGSNPTTSCSGTPTNYSVTYVGGTVTVNKLPITVTANSPSTTYGTSVTASGTPSPALIGSDTLSGIGVTCTTTDVATSAAGSNPTTSCSGNPTSYSVTYIGGTVTVNKLAITVTANSPTTTYGTAITASGTPSPALIGSDTLSSIGVTCSTTDVASSAVGSNPTTSCSGTPANYTPTYVGGSVTITQIPITVTANNPTTSYGTVATASGTVTSGSLLGSDTLSSIGITCTTTDATTSAVGSNPATSCSGAPTNYLVTYVGGSVTVNKAAITVTASSPAAVAYGTAAPAVNGAVTSGSLAGSDTLASIGVTCSTTITGAGTMPTSCSGSPANYSVTYIPGSLVVNPAAITVTASSPAAITYGTTAPAISGTVTVGSLVGSDTLASIGISCAVATTGAGTFPTSCSGSPANYTVTYIAGSLVVNPAPITVTASSPSTTYGAVATVTGTVTSGSLVGSDTLAGIGVTCTSTDAALSAVGSSPATSCSGTPTNYSITYVGGTVTIAKAAITVTASSPAAIVYGAAAPTVTGTVTSGALVGTDTLSNIGVSCSAASITGAGTFATSCAGTPANYTVTFVPGSLVVNQAAITVTASSPSITYGTTVPTVTGSVTSGTLVGSDTLASLGIACSAAGSPVNAGTYATSCSGTPANYAVTYVAGTLTIAKASQTITFGALANHNFGDAPFAISATASSNLTVAFSVVSGPATISGNTVTLTGAGTVVIEADQAGNTNYNAATAVRQSFLVAGASVGINVTTVTFGSQPVNTTSTAQTVVVTNTSGGTLSLSGVQASGDFAAAASCAAIPANGTCSISVTFTPTATGTRTGTLTINDNAPGSPQTVALSGTGIAPGVVVAPTSLVFGSQVVTTTSTAQTVTIYNTGTLALTVSSIAATGDYAVSGNCPTIPAGANCSFSVTFTPTATGTRPGTVTVTDNAGGGSQAVVLSGTGIALGATVTPATLSFPATTVGATSTGLITTLNNTGTVPLTGISIAAQGDFAQTSNCGATLGAGLSCNITVTFTPTQAAAETGTVVVTDSVGQQTVALNGTGLAASASLNTAQLLFGAQLVGTTSNAQTVVLTNQGNASLTLGAITAPANFSDTTNCGGSLAGGASCTINIAFTPSTTGLDTDAFTFPAGSATETIAVQGTGVAPGLALQPSFVIFGGQIVATTSPAQTLTAVNTGTVALTLNSIQIAGDFAQTNTCPSVLQPGATCLISVSFTPTALGSRAGSLTLTDATGTVTALATLSGQGTLPGIAVTPANLSFGSLNVGSASDAQTVTVANIGTGPATIVAVTASGDFAETDNCTGTTIAAGSNCIVSVTMTPTTMGPRTGTIQVLDSAGGTHNVALSGFGQQVGISIYPTSLNFGSSPAANTNAPVTLNGTYLSVTLTNVGNLPLDLDGYAVQGDFNQSNNCATTLAPGGRCTLLLTFNPTALGNRTGVLTVTDNAGAGTQTVALEGFGSPGGLTLTPPVLNFGVQTVGQTSQPQQATLTNNTGEDLDSLVITPSGEYGETNNCGTTLANTASCQLNITVTPVTVGAITGNVIVSGTLSQGVTPAVRTNAISKPDASNATFSLGVVALTATAVPPGIGLSIPELSFSATAVGTAATGQTITLTNTGTALDLTHLNITGTNGTEFPFTTNCPATLAPQASCTITVNFTPDAAGLQSGFMDITADGGIFAQMPESGIGIGPLLTVAPSTLTFGSRPVASTSTPQTLLLENTGGLPLTLSGITPSGDYHVAATTCALGQAMAVNATCTVSVVFTPTATGTRNAAIAFASNSTSGTVNVALNGSSNTAGLTISSLTLPFGPEGVGVSSAAKTFTLANNNSSAIGISSFVIAPGEYAQTNNCPASLAAGASCTVSVIFTPTATGEQDATLTVTSDAGPQAVSLTGAGSDFTINYAGTLPSAVTVEQGAITTYNLSLTSVAGDSQTISMTCTPSAGFTCSVTPAQVTIGAQPGAFTVQLVSTAREQGSAPALPTFPIGGDNTPWPLLYLAMALLGGAVIWKRRRAGLSLAGASLLLVFSAACATPSTPTAPSTYYVTVNATSSTGAQHSKTLDLVTK